MPPKKAPKQPTKKARKNEDADEEIEHEDEVQELGETTVLGISDFPMDKKFQAFFDGLPKREDVLHFFDRKEKYVLFADNALATAELYFNKASSVLSFVPTWPGRPAQVPALAVTKRQFHQVVRKMLLEHNFSIEVYASTKDAWVVSQQGSPGNLGDFEELATGADPHLVAVMGAVKMSTEQGNRLIGVAYVDTANYVLGYGEFLDNDQFTNLESFLVQVGVKECLYEKKGDGDLDSRKIRKVMDEITVKKNEIKSSSFGTKSLEQDLRNLLRDADHANLAVILERKAASEALAALIANQDLVASINKAITTFQLRHFDLEKCVRLDASALRALNLTPQPGDTNKTMNLYGVLNKCLTPMGSRRLLQWIRQPLVDIQEINKRLDVVEAFKTDAGLRKDLQTAHLNKIPDLMRIVKKFHQRKATLADCVRMYYVVEKLPNLRESLRAYSGPFQAYINGYIQQFEEVMGTDEQAESEADFQRLQEEGKPLGCKPLMYLILNAVDLAAASESHEYFLKPEYDEKLGVMSKELATLAAARDRVHTEATRDLGLDDKKKLKLEKVKQYGWVFRVGKKEETIVRPKLRSGKYTTCGAVMKAGQQFQSDKLKANSDETLALEDRYAKEQQAHVDNLIDIVAPYCYLLEVANNAIADLDVFQALAQTAEHYDYKRPKLTPMGLGDIRLSRARHPCLEAAADVPFKPNDVHLERERSRFQIITGPNMGGKSTFIRMASMLVIMAQMGSFVPAAEADVAIIDCVLARVGAGDNQLRGVSTFMAEMLETSSILKSATKHSLVVIDELGRGTSTYDGFGLAWAISEHICTKIKAFCFFATHFHELTELADRRELCVTNLHVKATTTNGKLELHYKVEPGPCDQSFGIHVAEMANFPPAVVELAKRKAEELEHFDDRSKRQAMNKEEQAAGEKLLDNFLTKFAAMPLNSLSAAEATECVNALKRELAQSSNIYVQKVLRLAG